MYKSKFLQATIDSRKTFSGAGIPDTYFTSKARTDDVLTVEHDAFHVLTY